jgi:hypothetical protein
MLCSSRPNRRVFEYKLGFWISATMPNRTPIGRKAECISACHLAEMAINDEKTAGRRRRRNYIIPATSG